MLSNAPWWLVWNKDANPSYGKAIQAESPQGAIVRHVAEDASARRYAESALGGEFLVAPVDPTNFTRHSAVVRCVVTPASEKGEG